MTIEELAAQRCAEEWNEAEICARRAWKADYFLSDPQDASSLYRLLVERIHHAITAYEAGDKTALEPFNLKPPVDPMEEVVREFYASHCENKGRSVAAAAWRNGKYPVTEAQKSLLRHGIELGRAERG